MNDTAAQLVRAAVRQFGEAAFTVEPYAADPEAESGSVKLTFAHPTRRGHQVEVVQRGNAFEVAYRDGLQPGPAEKLFVFAATDERYGVLEHVIGFLESVFAGQTVVYRERLSAVARFLRGDTCDSLLRFGALDEMTPRRQREVEALYNWRTR